MSSLNKVRKKYRFNVIDVLLIITVIVSIGAILFLYFYDGSSGVSKDDDELVEIIYTVEQKAFPALLRNKINIGDTVTNVGGEQIGNVIDREYTDAVYRGVDSEGNFFEEEYPGKKNINVKVKISALAKVDENGFYIVNGNRISRGQMLDLRFPYYTGEMECVTISEVNAG